MKKSKISINYDLDRYDKLIESKSDEIIDLDSITDIISKEGKKEEKCFDCEKKSNFNLKKFKPLDEQLHLDDLDDYFGRCSCGKRHIDVVMAQILKIMKEGNIEFKRFTLRNGPTPLLAQMFSNKNEPYIEKNSLIILHPKLTEDIAKRIMNEVSEVKGIIKGDPNDTVGLIDTNSEAISYELLTGSDIRCDIIQSPKGEIAINKIQHLSYLEFPPSMENKIAKLWEYLQSKQLSKEEISNLTVLDGTCGNGTLGIFLLKLGAKKVVFNDIWKPATLITLINLKANGFIENKNSENKKNKEDICKIASGDKFEIYNLPLEDLAKMKIVPETKKLDICILDFFPGTDTNNLEKTAKLLAKDILII